MSGDDSVVAIGQDGVVKPELLDACRYLGNLLGAVGAGVLGVRDEAVYFPRFDGKLIPRCHLCPHQTRGGASCAVRSQRYLHEHHDNPKPDKHGPNGEQGHYVFVHHASAAKLLERDGLNVVTLRQVFQELLCVFSIGEGACRGDDPTTFRRLRDIDDGTTLFHQSPQ